MKSKDDISPNQIRFAYFGDSLRIVYEVTPDIDEEIVEIRRAEIYSDLARSKSGWLPITSGMDILLGCLNSDFKEAIRECTYVISEDGELIRNSRVKQVPVNP